MLLEDMGDATLGERGAMLANELSHPPFTFKYESELETWFMKQFNALMDHIMAMWERPGQSICPPISWQQQNMEYRHYSGDLRQAMMDISIRVEDEVLTSGELKHGLRLTQSHFDALDNLRKRDVALWVRPYNPGVDSKTHMGTDGKRLPATKLQTNFYHCGLVTPTQKSAVVGEVWTLDPSRASKDIANAADDSEECKFWFADGHDQRAGDYRSHCAMGTFPTPVARGSALWKLRLCN